MAQGETSIHLTVGVHPVTRHSLLKHLLAEAADEPSLRASLPLGGDLADQARLADQLRETVQAFLAFAEAGRLPQVAGRLADELAASTRPEPIEPLAQLAALAALTPSTCFRLRPGLRARLAARTGRAAGQGHRYQPQPAAVGRSRARTGALRRAGERRRAARAGRRGRAVS